MDKSIDFKIFNAWQIKLIITFLMVLNHLHFVYNLLPGIIDDIFTLISRGVAPMFAFLAVEGIIHTRSLKKYCIRLSIWSFIVTVGNFIIAYFVTNIASNLPESSHDYLAVRTNITITLVAGVLCVALIKWARENKGIKKTLFFVGSVLCFLIGFVAEWGVVLLPFILVTFLLRERSKERYWGYVIIEVIAFLFRSEIFYFLAFPLIFLYNGERGPNRKFNKYFFYIFYPLHLWLIVLINYFLVTR